MTSSPSRRRARATALLSVTAVLPALLAGCSEGSGGGSSPDDVTSLTVGLSQNPETLDPAATGLIGAVKVDGSP